MLTFIFINASYNLTSKVSHAIINHKSSLKHVLSCPVACAPGFFLENNLNKKRVICYVDGFNLYHAIDSLKYCHICDLNVCPNKIKNKPDHCNNLYSNNQLKWLNLWRLAEAFIKKSTEEIIDVFYFTAIAYWIPESRKRHVQYIKALELFNVTVIQGHFKEKPCKCNSCKAEWTGHEEKQSDVNIATHLVHHAHLNKFDKAIVITADSDLCPPIQLVIDTYPEKEIMVLAPPNRYIITNELRGIVGLNKIKKKHLINNQLPEIVTDYKGCVLASKPAKYK